MPLHTFRPEAASPTFSVVSGRYEHVPMISGLNLRLGCRPACSPIASSEELVCRRTENACAQ